MQLLESPSKQSVVAIDHRLLNLLQDIVENVQISLDFCISHPQYKPLELPTNLRDRFKQSPLELQNKYLSLQLRSFLYGIYYNASMQKVLSVEAEAVKLAVHQDLENTTTFGVDLEFYEQLHESNQGEGFFDPGWSVVRQEEDSSLAVIKGGLTLHIDRELHLDPGDRAAKEGDYVAIRLPRNLVQNGFYVAVSNLGPEQSSDPDAMLQTGRVYFNLTPEGAIAVMEQLTQCLNATAIPFTFKALYNPSDYGRYDSAVLYFESSKYAIVRPVLQAVYQQHRSLFNPEVPLFTKLLAPGLAFAEEPDQKFTLLESFGQNRCQIVANGLLEALHSGNGTPEARMNSILQQFFLFGLDLQRPYLNANSEDIYTPLDV